MPWDVGKGLDLKRDERETSFAVGDESCHGRQDMPWETRHTAGGGCRRQVWRRKTSRKAEDASGGRRHIGRRKMHWKAEEASEAEAESETERHGIRGFPLHLAPCVSSATCASSLTRCELVSVQ